MTEKTTASTNTDPLDCANQSAILASHALKSDIKQLQMIPVATIKLLELTQTENTRPDDLVQIIETEPTLTARLLNITNAAWLSLANPTHSIAHAVNMLGFAEVRKIAIEQLLYNQLINSQKQQSFDQLFFWQHCLFVACLSKEIAIDLNYPEPESIYTAGLLHDIGKLVLENHGKATYSDFLQSNAKSDRPTNQNEQTFFGLTHAEIGRFFCHQWHLPAMVTAVVACHHACEEQNDTYADHAREIAIVTLANYIAWLHGLGSSRIDTGHWLPDSIGRHIDIAQLDFSDLMQRVDLTMSQTGQFYDITFPDLQKLRATLIFTALKLGQQQKANEPASHQAHKPLSSLLLPHHSLDAKSIILATLEAIHTDFAFERVIMFAMSINRQNLLAKYSWPPNETDKLLIPIEHIGGQLLDCLRHRQPIVIDQNSDAFGLQLLKRLQVASFVAVPVLRNNRLVGVLYADYGPTPNAIDPACALQIVPVANELGVALWNAKRFITAKTQAELDALTQLFNKGKINQLLAEIYGHQDKTPTGLAIGFVDIDHFKKFNDICGHQAGDDALKIVAEILRSMSRPDDFVGRYGGEEFVFALRNSTRKGAVGYAERMRFEIEKRGKLLSKRFNDLELTASIGISLYQPQFQTYLQHVESADRAMYQAKNQGRNRVVLINNHGA